MKELTKILDEMAEGPAVRFVAVVSKDGFIIANSSSADQADDLAAAQGAQLRSMANELGEELDSGGAKQIVVKYQKGLVVMDALDVEALLLTAVSNEASMAWVQFAAKKHLPAIRERLSLSKQIEA
jgi:predicted regulator of Ras-like GTPase activity (Roadblock/LC7/MglB family)